MKWPWDQNMQKLGRTNYGLKIMKNKILLFYVESPQNSYYSIYQPYVGCVGLSTESPSGLHNSFIINLLIYMAFVVVAASCFN